MGRNWGRRRRTKNRSLVSSPLSGAEKYKDAASELLTFESCRKKVPTNLTAKTFRVKYQNFIRNVEPTRPMIPFKGNETRTLTSVWSGEGKSSQSVVGKWPLIRPKEPPRRRHRRRRLNGRAGGRRRRANGRTDNLKPADGTNGREGRSETNERHPPSLSPSKAKGDGEGAKRGESDTK